MPGELTLVVEDTLTESIAHRILRHVDDTAIFKNCLGKTGIGFIEKNLGKLNQAARNLRFVVIADRDKEENCPIVLRQKWIAADQHQNLVVRFAEMEVEAWLLADRENLSTFLNVPLNRVPMLPDRIQDPKRTLVDIARQSRSKSIRNNLCPPQSSKSKVGPTYNQDLGTFVRDMWCPTEAARNSPSLLRTQERIRALAGLQGL